MAFRPWLLVLLTVVPGRGAEQLTQRTTSENGRREASIEQQTEDYRVVFDEERRPWTSSSSDDRSSIESINACPKVVQDAEPRTETSVSAFVDKLNREVKDADAGEGWDLVFLGDSITETWRGTDQGQACARCQGAPEIFYQHFGSRYNRTGVLAVGGGEAMAVGDQVGHLLWRLKNGQLPSKPVKLFVILIGTNDLGAAGCTGASSDALEQEAAGVISRTEEVVDLIRSKQANASILLVGILPRSSSWTSYDWPSVYTRAIRAVNQGLHDLAEKQGLSYVDCGGVLLPSNQDHIDREIMPDGLHPIASGLEKYAQCIAPDVARLMERFA